MCGGHFLHLLGGLMSEKSLSTGQAIPAGFPAPVETTTVCPSCQAFVPARFTWCPECGSALKSRPCAYCGQNLRPGDSACSNCGAPARQA